MQAPTVVTAALVGLLGLAGCGQTSSGIAPLPARDASSSAVLASYLPALVAGDCGTARRLAAPTFIKGNGELCGDVEVKAFVVNKASATPGPDEVEYGTVLDTAGSVHGTIPSGKTTWFYDLRRRDGQWRLGGGGSGP